MLRDPIELYEYPAEWYEGRDVEDKVNSGLFILTEDGFLRRGITTATTASAAMVAAISSLYGDVSKVKVATPAGIDVYIEIEDCGKGWARVRKFAGDHEFDATDGLIFEAEAIDWNEDIVFGEGVGILKGKKSVSRSAMMQLRRNLDICRERFGYTGGVLISVPDGRKVAKRIRSSRIRGGVSILGTTGFVEPWCKKLVETKLKIAMQYSKIAITTGRKAWLYALRNFPDYKPFVFGVHIDEALKHPGEKLIVGFPGILSIWAGDSSIEEKAIEAGARVVVIEDDMDSWVWNMQGKYH